MNTSDLLAATFADHEADAPDVTETRLRIEAELARTSHRRAPVIGAGSASAAVVAIAVAATAIGSGSGGTNPGNSVAVRPGTAPPSTAAVTRPPATVYFPFRPAWLPRGAKLDHTERGDYGPYYLEGYTIGSVMSAYRGVTLWLDDGTLPTSLRDGGTLHSTTIHGSPAVEGWSALARSYTVAIRRPDNKVMSVVAYGWDRATVTSFARRTAQHVEYGRFPVLSPAPATPGRPSR